MGYNLTSTHLWPTSVNELTLIFRDALLALIPIADRARMQWREPKNYDDWDSIAQSLFQSIVVSSLAHAGPLQPSYELPKYDVRIANYSENSFLSTSACPTDLAFVCFETGQSPFDSALFARLDTTGKVLKFERESVERVYFVLSSRSSDSIFVQDNIRVDL